MKTRVETYVKEGCTLCKDAREVIARVHDDMPFILKEVDITSSEDLFRRYNASVPTIFINGIKSFKFKVDEEEFRKKVRKEIIKAKVSRLSSKKLHYK
ncbi:MAG: glutaredoxin family protein [Deltaproteobacteria bacterium]|nr:glutaredoxin family protein [Deltaproteobacteria bacterium]